MKILILISLLIVTFSACKSKKVATTEVTEEVEKNVSEPKYVFENISDKDSLFASISKSACFGRCPVYTMNIYNNGLVEYNGKYNVEKVGQYTINLSYEEMINFVTVAKSINYMEMEDVYDNPKISDIPAYNTSIVINKNRKSIKRRFAYPKEILEFEKLFDHLLESDKWIKLETKADK